MKGLKSDLGIVITGGTISLNSADDAIHSNASVAVDGGDITISTGDDAIHADEHVSITGGNIKINNSHEGIEGAAVHIGGAALSIVSDEDGINASGGSDDADYGGRREPDAFKTNNGCIIRVTGGSINIAAGGDGIDSNGGILIVGGTLLINSDINSNNGALDYGSYCVIKGGTVAAAGGTAMAALPTSSSEQPAIALGLSPKRSGAIKIEDGSGSELFEWTPLWNTSRLCYPFPNSTLDLNIRFLSEKPSMKPLSLPECSRFPAIQGILQAAPAKTGLARVHDRA